MQIDNDIKLNFDDVLIRPKRSSLQSRNDVSLEREFEFKNSKNHWTGVPIISSNMDSTGTFEMYSVLSKYNMPTAINKFYKEKDWDNFYKNNLDTNFDYVIPTIGGTHNDIENYNMSINSKLNRSICVDVANGYSEFFINIIKMVRYLYPSKTIIAGNVVTGDMTEQLIVSGADIVKVGIGPGSACTTRIKTGIGYPQLSAIMECADAAHGLGGHIIADGGCKNSGDIAKAIGAGADFVMLGGMFAGTNEASGDIIENEKGTYKLFYGMSSDIAQMIHNGEQKDYRASEGREIYIPYTGSVEDIIKDILGGLRSACTYVGASKLKELSKRTTFIRTNNQYNKIFEKYEV